MLVPSDSAQLGECWFEVEKQTVKNTAVPVARSASFFVSADETDATCEPSVRHWDEVRLG